VANPVLLTYADRVIARLLTLHDPNYNNGKQPKRYVTEQVITTLAALANVYPTTFATVSVMQSKETFSMIEFLFIAIFSYHAIADRRSPYCASSGRQEVKIEGYRMCRCPWFVAQALSAADLLIIVYIAIAAGRDIFRQHASTIADLLLAIQSMPYI
jgi:hypothetical protein